MRGDISGSDGLPESGRMHGKIAVLPLNYVPEGKWSKEKPPVRYP
jgi:hypothetical protein